MPKRFNLLQSNDVGALKNQINQNFAMLDKEVDTKTFFDRGTGETLTIGNTGDDTSGMSIDTSTARVFFIGRYGVSRYGLIVRDSDGIRRVLVGFAPDDGRPGIWVSKPGMDVITLLGG